MGGFSKASITINQIEVKYFLGCITCRGCSRCLVYSGVSMFPDQLSTDELVEEAQRTRFYVESIMCSLKEGIKWLIFLQKFKNTSTSNN